MIFLLPSPELESIGNTMDGLCTAVNGFQGFVPDSTLAAEIHSQSIVVLDYSDMHNFIFNTRDLCFDNSGSGDIRKVLAS